MRTVHPPFQFRTLFFVVSFLAAVGAPLHDEQISYLWNFNRIAISFPGNSYYGPANIAVYADTADVQMNANGEWEVFGTAVIEAPGVGYAICSDPRRVHVGPASFGIDGIFEILSSYWSAYDLKTTRPRQSFNFSSITTYTTPLSTSVGLVGVGNIQDNFYLQVTLIPEPAPAILQQPLSVQVVEGASPTLTAALQGAEPFSIQWRKNGAPVSGRNFSSLTISNSIVSDSGEYDVVVTNMFGATASQKALLTVNQSSPVITTNPVSQGAMLGGPIILEAAAIGTKPITWQWYLDDVPVPGATSNRLVRAKADVSMLGRYKAVASNALGDTPTAEVVVDQSGIIAWGRSVGILPSANTNIISITGGDIHFLALRSNGHVQTWSGTNGPSAFGYNAGQTTIPADLDRVIGIGAGSTHSLALRDDGTITAWGKIYFTSTSNLVQQLNRDIVMVGTGVGAQHAVALKRDGTVLGWGASTNYPYLQEVPAKVTNIVSVAAGARHGLALRGDGGVVAWGDNSKNQLNIPASATNVIAISTTWDGNLALRADGRVIWWGGNTAPPSQTNFVDLAGGATWMVGLLKNGQVIAKEPTTAGVTPVPLAATNAAGVAAGSYTAFALLGSGPPVFNTATVDRRVALGTNAFFRMWAIGAQPITYQWSFNGQLIPEATNSWFVVPNVQAANLGFYTLIASNKFGSVACAPMRLNVPLITRVAASPSQLQIEAQTSPSLLYKLESKVDLLDPAWEPVKEFIADSEMSVVTIDGASPAVQRRFYRIRLQ